MVVRVPVLMEADGQTPVEVSLPVLNGGAGITPNSLVTLGRLHPSLGFRVPNKAKKNKQMCPNPLNSLVHLKLLSEDVGRDLSQSSRL